MGNPTLMSMPICRDAEKNTIPATDNGTTGKFSEQYGWQGINSLPLSAGGKAVERLDFNGVLGLLGGIDYMTQRGYTFEWDSNLPYVVGCIVIDTLDGKTYRCVNDVPAGSTAPSLDSTNWVVYDIADYVGGALRLTTYNVGDTSTLPNIPAGYFLECTTGGITGTYAPPVSMPVVEGNTITDGTVTWAVRKCAKNSDLAKYVPKTISNDYGWNQIMGGTDSTDGASILIYGQNVDFPDVTDKGMLDLNAKGNGDEAEYKFRSNGKVTINDIYDMSSPARLSQTNTTNWYIKDKSNLIMQGGQVTMSAGNTVTYINFPISFSSHFKLFATCTYGADTSLTRKVNCGASGSLQGVITIDSAYSSNMVFNYFAIGY